MRDLNSFQSFIPHGQSYLWKPEILWLSVISDGLIFLAYISISATLVILLRNRPNFAHKWLFVMFSLFTFFCGITHLMNIWIIWNPDYVLEGFIKALTATFSVVTAVLVVPMGFKVLSYIKEIEIGFNSSEKAKLFR